MDQKHKVLLNDKWAVFNDKIISTSAKGFIKVGICLQTNDKVCVKELSFDWFRKGPNNEEDLTWMDFKYNCVQEAKLMEVVTGHPHIVEYYDYVVNDEARKVYIIMEFVKGSMTLDKYFERVIKNAVLRSDDWRKKEGVAVQILRQLLSAIGCLHWHFIAHRDIRMENILVIQNHYSPEINDHIFPSNDKKPNFLSSYKIKSHTPISSTWKCPHLKLFDFGNATIFFDGETDKFLNGGLETGIYMSPEANLKARHVGYSLDIWSLGIIAQLVGTGTHPFGRAKPVYSMSWDIVQRTIDGKHKRLKTMSDYFKHFCSRALEPKFHQRANIWELIDHPFVNSISYSPFEPPISLSLLPKRYAPAALTSLLPWTRLPVERPVYRIYNKINLYLPETRQQPIIAPDTVDPLICDELRQGYYGWWTSYKAEEIDPIFIEATVITQLVADKSYHEKYVLEKTIEGLASTEIDIIKIILKEKNYNGCPVASLYLFLRDHKNGDIWKSKNLDEKATPSRRIRDVLYSAWKLENDVIRKQSIYDNSIISNERVEEIDSRRISDTTVAYSTISIAQSATSGESTIPDLKTKQLEFIHTTRRKSFLQRLIPNFWNREELVQ